jgi:hypothetical protein
MKGTIFELKMNEDAAGITNAMESGRETTFSAGAHI